MPTICIYVSDELANCIRHATAGKNMSVSRYMADLARRELIKEWPKDFFEKVVGGWQGELEQGHVGPAEVREELW
jgi:hypothetical protein